MLNLVKACPYRILVQGNKKPSHQTYLIYISIYIYIFIFNFL